METANNVGHVPGPWRVFGLGIKWVSHGQWRLLAKAGGTGLTIEANMANARLIAAAPELLAALQALELRARGLDQSVTHDGLQNCDALANARAAIAKATGHD